MLGAAACFVAIQAIRLKQFCPWCMGTHLGAAAAALVVGATLLWCEELSQNGDRFKSVPDRP